MLPDPAWEIRVPCCCCWGGGEGAGGGPRRGFGGVEEDWGGDGDLVGWRARISVSRPDGLKGKPVILIFDRFFPSSSSSSLDPPPPSSCRSSWGCLS